MFVLPNETELNNYTEAKAFIFERKEEIINTLNTQKSQLKLWEEQYQLAKLIVEKSETDKEFDFAIERQKMIVKKIEEEQLIEKSLENIDLGESILEKIDKVIAKYFTEEEYNEDGKVCFKYNEYAIAFGEILEALK